MSAVSEDGFLSVSTNAGCHHFWRFGERGYDQLGTASALTHFIVFH